MAQSLASHRLSRSAPVADPTTSAALTRTLLGCGILAGPLYLAVGLGQALTRPGFDLTRHELSQLAVGEWGWIQITNFYVAGLLVIASALGIQRILRSGPGWTWTARLVALYGVGLIGAGLFTADPGLGFPPGTATDAITVSSHGMLHLAFAAMGFCGLIAASIVFGRRDLALGHAKWATYSITTGVIFLATFVSGIIFSGSTASHALATLMLWIGVLLAWCWLATTSFRLRREQ